MVVPLDDQGILRGQKWLETILLWGLARRLEHRFYATGEGVVRIRLRLWRGWPEVRIWRLPDTWTWWALDVLRLIQDQLVLILK